MQPGPGTASRAASARSASPPVTAQASASWAASSRPARSGARTVAGSRSRCGTRPSPARTSSRSAAVGNYGQIAAGEVRCTGIDSTAVATPPLNADFRLRPARRVDDAGRRARRRGIVALLGIALWLYGRLPAGAAHRAARAARRAGRAADREVPRRAVLLIQGRRRLVLGVGSEARGRGPAASTPPAASPTTRRATCTCCGRSGS